MQLECRIHSIDAQKKQVGLTMKSSLDDSDSDSGGNDGRRKARPQRSGGDRAAQKASIVALAGAFEDLPADTFIDGT